MPLYDLKDPWPARFRCTSHYLRKLLESTWRVWFRSIKKKWYVKGIITVYPHCAVEQWPIELSRHDSKTESESYGTFLKGKVWLAKIGTMVVWEDIRVPFLVTVTAIYCASHRQISGAHIHGYFFSHTRSDQYICSGVENAGHMQFSHDWHNILSRLSKSWKHNGIWYFWSIYLRPSETIMKRKWH